MNANEYVWVRLTEQGKNALKTWTKPELSDAVFERHNQKYGGWFRFQLWELMQIFGSLCFNGGQQLFEDNEVRLEEPPKPEETNEPKLYHVVLKRVMNFIVDNVPAMSELKAIEAAEQMIPEDRVNNVHICDGVTMDAGEIEDVPGAAVDTLDKDGNYEVESYYEVNHRGDYEKKR